jgi:hypothetical protein
MMRGVAHGGDQQRREANPFEPLDRSLSLGALRLHAQALLASFEAGHAGFVSDEYLTGVAGDTAVTVLELCVAGVWARAADGYRVVSSEALRMAAEVHRQMSDEPAHHADP